MTKKDPVAKYYPALDGFRAMAVLMVFSTHYVGTILPVFHNWGWIGVDFFFVLSGFLITGILWDSRAKQNRFRDFYARRILRIFPLYYAVWLVLLLLWPVFHWRWNWGWLLWPLHLGNFARFIFFQPSQVVHMDVLYAGTVHLGLVASFMGHFWSLCVEEQFYLVWPCIVLLIASQRRLIHLSVAVILVEPCLRLLLLYLLPKQLLDAEFLYRFTFTRLDSLVLGGLLAILLRGSQAEAVHRYGRLLTGTSVLLVACMLGNYVLRRHTVLSYVSDPVLSTFGLTLIDLLALGLILELIRGGSPIATVFEWSPLRRLGQVSYGFYVFHDLPHLFYSYLGSHFHRHTAMITTLIAFVSTLALSLASYRWFETPFLRLKTRFASQVHHAPEA